MNLLRNKYKILHSSLIIGFIAILLILLLEIGARVIYSEEDSGYCYTEHDVLYYIPKKYCQKKAKAFEGKTYTRSFNECGYISKHSCKEKLPGTFRIVGLGDSNTEGYGVSDDETYLAVLEGALQSRVKNAKIETFNLGVCGYDLPQYMQRTPEALQLKPDVLIVGILANDFYPNLSEEAINKEQELIKKIGVDKALKQRDDQVWMERFSLPQRIKQYCSKNFRSLNVLLHYAYLNKKLYTVLFLNKGADLPLFSASFSPFWDKQLRDGEKLISKIASESKSRGTKFVLLYIPNRINAAFLSVTYDEKLITPFALGDKLKELANRDNFVFIDFTEALRKQESPERLYYPVNSHLNEEGHALLGIFLTDQLIEQKVVSPKIVRP